MKILGLSIIHSARIFFFLLKNKMCIFCRLNGDQNGGAWCSASPVSRDLGSKEYIEGNSSAQSSSLQIYSNLHKFTHFALIFSVDLGSMHCITGAMTQGRFGNGRGVEFTEAYKLQYWRPGMSDFVLYHDSMGRSVSFCLYLIHTTTISYQKLILDRYMMRYLPKYILVIYWSLHRFVSICI